MLTRFFILALALSFAQQSFAQQPAPLDEVDKVLITVFQANNSKFLCLSANSSLPEIRKQVEAQLRRAWATTPPSADDVAKAAYTIFPCPFSPYRSELRPATAEDVEGVWLTPTASMKFRFGPQAPAWAQYEANPLTCEAVGYYPEGEVRVGFVTGMPECPFAAAKDMDAARGNPKVSTWKFVRKGLLKVSRTDVPNYLEEWEMFVVVEEFSVAGVQFVPGDMLGYLRKESGNDMNVTTAFRHLHRLP